jgi:YrbI family 3-deoxy-D-manno-octulosonate 8-phosphate phosphatase
MGMLCCAIIPARGGSKGIVDKNLREVAGKPLIGRSVEVARQARHVDRVYVTTDSPAIADVARGYGASVIMRPDELSGDAASSESALLHALDYMATEEHYAPDLLAFLQCSSPLTAPADVDGTIEAVLSGQADTALAVTGFHYFVWQRDADGNAVGINHDKRHRPRRQDREAQYLETGAVYVMRVAGFRQSRHRFFGRTALYEIPSERVLEIDDPVDLEMAEVLLRRKAGADRRARLPSPVAGLAMDFDGVFTDNRVLVSQDGTESVACSRGDGMGLERLRKQGLPMVVISKEANPVVQRRCEKLLLPCFNGIEEKRSLLLRWCEEQGLDIGHVIYVGNDVNDLECLRAAGCGVVVADAHPEARRCADVVLETAGGHGALRELADLLQAAERGEG